MARSRILLAALCAAVAGACSDRSLVTRPDSVSTPGAAPAAPSVGPLRPERLARMLSRALADSVFRTYVKQSLDASPFVEHKLQFQAWLHARDGTAMRYIARANGIPHSAVAAEAASAVDLEIYLPVPAHRARWTGGDDLLVATALEDHEAPVAFDTRGRRQVLRPDTPPDIPVIALVPVETDFRVAPARQKCLTCSGDGGYLPPPRSPVVPGLYMTAAHFEDDFEGWLKGNPEFEVHVLGQSGQTDSLVEYQCSGEHAPSPYTFDQNGKDWAGNVLLFSSTQIAAYNSTHPGQNIRVFFVEDDDTACVIKTGKDLLGDLLDAVDEQNGRLTAGNDSTTSLGKAYKRGTAFQQLWAAAASLIKTNDELIGNAVEDVVTSEMHPGYDWVVKGSGNQTNGWVKLEMK